MIVKTYTASTTEEAMANAKAELGQNIILLTERKQQIGGFLCFGGKKIVEVTVVLEDTYPKNNL
ncbi:hypothetical protein [uncultured Anaerovibrio sp.]|uniref:hypothetical protein n=1 Tax=uncultured Anaerovibrio sp. TaxID=361586 RepID=UPI0025D2E250|nr:hypothetical protein [uncultured Anaerovibrio sp.]